MPQLTRIFVSALTCRRTRSTVSYTHLAERYNRAVKQGCWQLDIPESIGRLPQMELYGNTYGVYGYGSIGRQSARIARAFGMEVLVCTRTVRPEYAADGVEFCLLYTSSQGRCTRPVQRPCVCRGKAVPSGGKRGQMSADLIYQISAQIGRAHV